MRSRAPLVDLSGALTPALPTLSRAETAEIFPTPLVGGEQPFVPENFRRLASMGWITIGLCFLGPALNYRVGRVVLGRLPGEGMPLTPLFDFDGNPSMGGIALLGLALIFRHGTELETEHALRV